jgi:hypothetical protein
MSIEKRYFTSDRSRRSYWCRSEWQIPQKRISISSRWDPDGDGP